MTIYPNRRGITLFELLWGMLFLAAALWVLSRPSYRVVEIVRVLSGDMHYDSLGEEFPFLPLNLLFPNCCFCRTIRYEHRPPILPLPT